MEIINFNSLLLKTAFSCMACDGHIDKRELKLIKKMHVDNNYFGEMNIDSELNILLTEINKDGHLFLKNFLKKLTSVELSENEEIKLIEAAIETIKSDEKVEYSEIKFFKVIRSKLKIGNVAILSKHPDFEEYLEQDILSDSYLSRLQDNFFDTQVLPKFELKNIID
ncbi:MAG: hypothetical protein ABIN48_03510 [Ginsengibacter sp.]